MLDRFLGGYVTASPTAPTQTSAQGVWELEQQASAQVQNAWPLPPNVIQRSLRFDGAAYLDRTPATASNRTTWTWSGWVKLGSFADRSFFFAGSVSSPPYVLVGINGSGAFFTDYFSSAGVVGWRKTSSSVYRDPSAWYHFVVSVDTTLGTPSDRVKLYVNGTQITSFSSSTDPSTSATAAVNNTVIHNIGRYVTGGYMDGYMTEINFVDGQQLTPSSFGETDPQTGVWIPKVYTGSYGTNGFRLRFNNNSSTTALGYDTSGNGNNWTPNNFSVTAGSGNDSMLDVPSLYGTDTGLGGEVRGNYCTLNPLASALTGLNNGNLNSGTSGAANWKHCRSTFGLTSGKWYWECLVSGAPDGSNGYQAGVLTDSASLTADPNSASTGFYTRQSTNKYANGTRTDPYFTSTVANDILMFAFDADTGKMWNGKNGVWEVSGNPTAGTGENWSSVPSGVFPMAGIYGSSITITPNFGQRPFAYTAPSGFKALCTTNLSAPSIGQTSTNQAGDYFNTVLYTGTGSSLSVTGTGFQPDLVWIKSRSAATDHALYDAVRGVQKQLESNTTTAETTETTGLTAFGSDGFTVGALAQVNTSSATYVAWQWYAGGSTVTNTQGTITSSVRANPASGFSVVTFTGSATNNSVGHGLGITPSFVIVKSATEVASWVVYHSSLVSNGLLILNSTAAVDTTIPNYWGSGMTSSVIGVYAGGIGGNNRTGQTMIAYCFAAIPGFSAFGSYTGNGSTDGPFVYTGFRPRWLLIKTTASGYGWQIFDTARAPYNVVQVGLDANTSGAEYSTSVANTDILSNGFKIRTSDPNWNTSSGTYIYAAFAEYPFRLALAR